MGKALVKIYWLEYIYIRHGKIKFSALVVNGVTKMAKPKPFSKGTHLLSVFALFCAVAWTSCKTEVTELVDSEFSKTKPPALTALYFTPYSEGGNKNKDNTSTPALTLLDGETGEPVTEFNGAVTLYKVMLPATDIPKVKINTEATAGANITYTPEEQVFTPVKGGRTVVTATDKFERQTRYVVMYDQETPPEVEKVNAILTSVLLSAGSAGEIVNGCFDNGTTSQVVNLPQGTTNVDVGAQGEEGSQVTYSKSIDPLNLKPGALTTLYIYVLKAGKNLGVYTLLFAVNAPANTYTPTLIAIPLRTAYQTGGRIEKTTDIAVYLQNSDGVTVRVPPDEFSLTPSDQFTTAGAKTINVNHTATNLSASYSVWVTENTAALMAIPVKTNYVIGSKIEKATDLIVYKSAGGVMTQLSSSQFTVTANGTSDTDEFISIGTKTVTVSASNATNAQYTVNVAEVAAQQDNVRVYVMGSFDGNSIIIKYAEDGGTLTLNKAANNMPFNTYEAPRGVWAAGSVIFSITANGHDYLWGRKDNENIGLKLDANGELQLRGEGLENDPYLIGSYAEFQMIRRDSAAIYKQEANIDLLGADSCTQRQQWDPIDTFSGVFDGGGCTINNIYINQPTASNLGLFEEIKGTVKGVHIASGTISNNMITGGPCIGGIAASISDTGEVIACSNASNISGKSYVGGIAGKLLDGGSIKACYNSGTIIGFELAGGIVGQTLTGTSVISCRNSGTLILFGNSAGGIAGIVDGSITACYSTGAVCGTENNNLGGIAGELAADGSINDCYWDNSGVPVVVTVIAGYGIGSPAGFDDATPFNGTAAFPNLSSVSGWETSADGGYWKPGTINYGMLPKLYWEQ
jgi:hypothetical protein